MSMSLSFELVLAYMILIPFIIANIIFAMGSLFQNKTAKFLQRALKVEEKFSKSQNKRYKVFRYVNFIIWLTVGIVNMFSLDNLISIGAILVLFAFRSGTTLSKRFIFGIHDIRVMKQHLSDKKITKIISRVVKIGIIIELMFIFMWGILYKYLSVSVKTTLGIEVNVLVMILWSTGFIYGIVFSLILSVLSKDIILTNEIGIVLLLSGEFVREKIKKTKIIPKFFKH